MKEPDYVPTWVGLVIVLILGVFIVVSTIQVNRMRFKIDQLKTAITGPEKNHEWNGGHASVAVVKHSPNCSCLK